eukprot:TRINITY_DN1331_c0_g1_i1.p1 TRINITY_DN1331_c0_g1~~TRINITY_DN1331_c0_g1_i1.p1  ORF type:complete len:374 (-),score=139.01 TRINITY_DN1331_c0_g1_i1:43-1164(-)
MVLQKIKNGNTSGDAETSQWASICETMEVGELNNTQAIKYLQQKLSALNPGANSNNNNNNNNNNAHLSDVVDSIGCRVNDLENFLMRTKTHDELNQIKAKIKENKSNVEENNDKDNNNNGLTPAEAIRIRAIYNEIVSNMIRDESLRIMDNYFQGINYNSKKTLAFWSLIKYFSSDNFEHCRSCDDVVHQVFDGHDGILMGLLNYPYFSLNNLKDGKKQMLCVNSLFYKNVLREIMKDRNVERRMKVMMNGLEVKEMMKEIEKSEEELEKLGKIKKSGLAGGRMMGGGGEVEERAEVLRRKIGKLNGRVEKKEREIGMLRSPGHLLKVGMSQVEGREHGHGGHEGVGEKGSGEGSGGSQAEVNEEFLGALLEE